MPDRRQLILAVFIHNSGSHPGGWRYPREGPLDQHDFGNFARLAKKAEQAKLHIYFSGDSMGYPNIKGRDAFAATDYAGKLEPSTLLGALAAVTQHIGLVATMSTTFNEPYAVARRFASLDHISGGRAGWNVVTSTSSIEARNFGFEKIMDHDRRYERAEEFVDVVRGLWDSWEDDAIIRDAAAGRYFSPEKVHQLDHEGEFFRVAGPLNIGRPPQGHPVIVQAGGSPPGRALAARTADLIFTAQNNLSDARAFYYDMKQRAAGFGRDPSKFKVIPSVQFIIGGTEEEAKRKQRELIELIPDALAIQTLQLQIGADLSHCSPRRHPARNRDNGGRAMGPGTDRQDGARGKANDTRARETRGGLARQPGPGRNAGADRRFLRGMVPRRRRGRLLDYPELPAGKPLRFRR